MIRKIIGAVVGISVFVLGIRFAFLMTEPFFPSAGGRDWVDWLMTAFLVFAGALFGIMLYGFIDLVFEGARKCDFCQKQQAYDRDRLQDGRYECGACTTKREIANEAIRQCPSCDDSPMQKEPICDDSIIIDRCPSCQGVFLDPGELEKINEEHRSNSSSKFATGLVIGLAIN
jgi:hypothetical protein